MADSKKMIAGAALVFCSIGLVTFMSFKNADRPTALPVYGEVPDFQLTDSEGRKFDDEKLRGKPWIASFLFTRCKGQCPLMVSQLSRISRKIPNARFFSVTSDPVYDNPGVIKKYMETQNGPSNWVFAGGEKSEIEKITNAFMMTSPGNPEIHSTRFVLIDADNKIRGFYDSQQPAEMNAIVEDVRGMIKQSGEIA